MYELVSELQLVQAERREVDIKPFYFLALNIKEIYINWLKALCKLKYNFVLKNKNGNRKVDLKKIQWLPKVYTLLTEGITEVSKQLTLMHVALKRQNHVFWIVNFVSHVERQLLRLSEHPSSTRCRVGFVLLCLIFCVIFYIFSWSLYCLSYVSWFLSTFLIVFANGEKEREIKKNNCERRGQFAKASMAAISYKYNHIRVDNRGAHHWHHCIYYLKNLDNHELCKTRTNPIISNTINILSGENSEWLLLNAWPDQVAFSCTMMMVALFR